MGNCPKCGSWNRGDKFFNGLCPKCSRAKNDEEKLTQLKIKETKRNLRDNNNSGGGSKFHLLYGLLVGWWLAMILVACIVPLFFSGGRRLIKKVFGIW
jgi:uncharacterized membrane protein YvbJ